MTLRVCAAFATLVCALCVCRAPAAAQPFGGCGTPPAVTSVVPADVSLSQPNVNCFAWQEFIALNWLADTSTCAADSRAPASSFGDPQNSGPVVWQTYKGLSEVFLEDAKPPPDWCEPQTANGTRPYALAAPSEFALGPKLDLSDFNEVAPHDSWLTAQSGLLTLYDIRINQDEFAYIDANELYNAETQRTVAASSEGLSLPDGSNGATKTGSIELKAAWTELDDPAQYPNFLTTTATVTYPGKSPKTATMGLVGLHIIHKTQNAQQFVWATFEHVDNLPRPGDSGPYTFFNASCNPASDHYKCAANPNPCATVDPEHGCPQVDPYDAPQQVVRTKQAAIQPDVASLNQAVWKLISAASPRSVFLNYQLINVLWPNSSFTVPPNSRAPLLPGVPQPPLPETVANSTLETYVQKQSCLSCHVYGAVASATPDTIEVARQVTTPAPPSAPFAADYSFVLGHAQSPPGTPTGLIAGVAAATAAATAGAFVLLRRRRTEP
jgi:hypothetical protein